VRGLPFGIFKGGIHFAIKALYGAGFDYGVIIGDQFYGIMNTLNVQPLCKVLEHYRKTIFRWESNWNVTGRYTSRLDLYAIKQIDGEVGLVIFLITRSPVFINRNDYKSIYKEVIGDLESYKTLIYSHTLYLKNGIKLTWSFDIEPRTTISISDGAIKISNVMLPTYNILYNSRNWLFVKKYVLNTIKDPHSKIMIYKSNINNYSNKMREYLARWFASKFSSGIDFSEYLAIMEV